MDTETIEKLIRRAMNEAEKGIKDSNSPFGAVLTDMDGNVVAEAHNTTKTENDPTAHAEINVLRKAGKELKNRQLHGLCLFSNASSCSMCMIAAMNAGITNFYFGAPNEKHMDPFITPQEIAKKSSKELHIHTGILECECVEQVKWGRNSS